MPNKNYSDVANYLVEGAKNSGYLKGKGKGFGDGATSSPVKDFNVSYGDAGSWFEGTKSSVGQGEKS